MVRVANADPVKSVMHVYLLKILSHVLLSAHTIVAFVYLRPRYLQSRKDEQRKTKQTTLGDTTTGLFTSAESEGPQLPSKKGIFQTMGDAFRNGAIDEEKDLSSLEASSGTEGVELIDDAGVTSDTRDHPRTSSAELQMTRSERKADEAAQAMP
jgi:hypothetical protein